jgi:hypothetical protein
MAELHALEPEPLENASDGAALEPDLRIDSEASLWGIGLIFAGAFLLMLMGCFHFVIGLAAVTQEEFFTIRPNYDMALDVQTWGWVQMIGGIFAAIAGTLLLTGTRWARYVCILLLTLSMLWSFYSIPYYPVWSIVIIAIDAAVLWALIVHGDELVFEEAAG